LDDRLGEALGVLVARDRVVDREGLPVAFDVDPVPAQKRGRAWEIVAIPLGREEAAELVEKVNRFIEAVEGQILSSR